MNSSRRWLIGFVIAISILAIATVSLVLVTSGSEVALLPEDTPQGTVQRYLIAVQEKNYQEAYRCLSIDSSRSTTYDDWLLMVIGEYQISNQSVWKATLSETTQKGDSATVEVTIDTFRSGGLFEDPLRSQQILFQLSNIDGTWLITSPTYTYWIY